MKRLLPFHITLALLMVVLTAAGQHIPGKQVNRQTTPAMNQMPGPVTVFQPALPLKLGQTLTPAGFIPRQVNPHAFRLDPSVFTDVVFDGSGRLVFTEGRLPDAVPLHVKSGDAVLLNCIQYLEAIRLPLGISSPTDEFEITSVETDALGQMHIRISQKIGEVPVYGGDAYLHARNGYIDRYTGYLYPTPSLTNLTPQIGSAQAVQRVISHVSGQTVYRSLSDTEKQLLNYSGPERRLVVYHKDRNPDGERLTWHITIRPNLIERWEYFLDAGNGEIIHFYNNTQSDGDVLGSGTDLNGVNQTFHVYLEAGTYYMADISKPMFNPQNFEGVIKTYDAFNAPYNQINNASIVTSSNNTWAPNAISAHYHASLSYDYWKNVHNRNSYNNLGASIINVINITSESGQGFDNAFWSGQAMFYGNGGSMFKPLAGALDVCAHEFGHAVDETSANLEYQNQSGAINETYSDIIGAMVERKNWKIGEDIIKPGNPYFPTGAMRDMANPHNGGSSFNDPCYQPAHVSEMYIGNQDNGGVHINSGIGNHAYYLFATAVGNEKGEKTFMRALFHYLTRSSQFIDFRIAVVQSAKDLYGNNSTEANAAGQAFDQVGITDGSGSGGGGTTAPGNLQVNPGQDYILLHDEYLGDNYTLFITNNTATEYTPISQTGIKNKPSVLDDGSAAVFISDDNKMRAISLAGNPNETIIQNEPIWDGVAISKDGALISAVTMFQDSAIYIYSYEKQQWAKFPLYNPGTQQGVKIYNVLYADAMEWLYDGEYLMYDSYSRVNGPSGQTIEFWDINFIRVWNKAANTWGDGQVFKLMTGLEPGVSIGNPSLAKNSTHIAAFDMMDENNNTTYILAVDLDKGEIGEIFNNGDILGTPNYSKMDDKLIFTTWHGNKKDIAVIGLQPDKIHASGNAQYMIPEAKWGIWFSQGVRALSVEEVPAQRNIRIFPNPADDIVTINIEDLRNEKVGIYVFDPFGKMVHDENVSSTGPNLQLNLGTLPEGIYFIRCTGKNFSATGKIMIR